MLDAALIIMGPLLGHVLIAGRNPPPAGNLPFGGSPFSGIFATADGLLSVVGSTPRQCIGICRVLGLADLLEDPRIADWQNHPELGAELGPMLAQAYRERTAEAWENAFAAADVPAGKIRDLWEILHHPHVLGRGLLRQIDRVPGIERTLTVPNVGFKLDDESQSPLRPPPRPAANTREVLRELGYAEPEIDALEASGAVARSS